MKLSKFIILISVLGCLTSASVEYHAGRNYMWPDKVSGVVGATIYVFGETSFDNSNLEHITRLGYSQTIKSPLKDKWKYDKNGVSGSVTINRYAREIFESIVVEGKENGINWTDISVFGEGNALTRRTICKNLDCYVVSKSLCNKITTESGAKTATEAKEIAKTCQSMSQAFANAMTKEKKSTTLEKDFNSDMKKASNTWRSKKMNLGETNTLGAQSIFGYLQACSEMDWYNKAKVINTSSQRPRVSAPTRRTQ